MATITEPETDLLARYIFEHSGISLDRGKGYLLEVRLSPLLRAYGCKSFSDLYQKTRDGRHEKLQAEIIDAISTNETYFFRDVYPFEMLRHQIIPDLLARRRAGFSGKIPLRIWSAACSTGQEVYSNAMVLLEMLGNLKSYEIVILGTDISSRAINQAREGRYNSFEVERGLAPAYRDKYFVPEAGKYWRIKEQVRSLVRFQESNLLHSFAGLGTFDIVFCRNVAIYFDPVGKKRLFSKLAATLNPWGVLILGGSESLHGVSDAFVPLNYRQYTYYVVKDTTAALSPEICC